MPYSVVFRPHTSFTPERIVECGTRVTTNLEFHCQTGYFATDNQWFGRLNADDNSTFFSGLPEYDLDAGLISVGLHLSAIIPLCDTTSLIGFADFDQLPDEIGRSSIVDDRSARDQLSDGGMINDTFNNVS